MQDSSRSSSITSVATQTAKKVKTYDLSGQENGFLVELFKDGPLTTMYLTAASPGAFKGYHEHKIRGSRYICIKGKMKIILYVNGKREEHILDDDPPKRLFIPPNVPTGLQNIGDTTAWLINYPDPPYDPSIADEQIDYTQEELEKNT